MSLSTGFRADETASTFFVHNISLPECRKEPWNRGRRPKTLCWQTRGSVSLTGIRKETRPSRQTKTRRGLRMSTSKCGVAVRGTRGRDVRSAIGTPAK